MAHYRHLFGIDLASDKDLDARLEPGTANPVVLQNQSAAAFRDEHLLATIDKELDSKRRVLVVFGGSHWTTLSQALQQRLGKPRITPFLD